MITEGTTSRAYVIASFLMWGLLPIYWRSLRSVPALEVLSHRVLWASLFFAMICWSRGGFHALRSALSQSKTRLLVLATSVLIAVNWGTYVTAVVSGHVLEASLGYYLSPLFNIWLGVVFLKERLTPLAKISVGLAGAGVSVLFFQQSGFPVFALTLTVTFGFYSLLRKKLSMEPAAASLLESLILAPIALGFLAHSAVTEPVHWITPGTFVLLCLSGVATGLPMLWFTEGSKKLPMTSTGFFQFITPTCQLALATLMYAEPFTRAHAVAFSAIWIAIALYCWDLWTRAYPELKTRVFHFRLSN